MSEGSAADRLIRQLIEARGPDEQLPLAERLAALSREQINGGSTGVQTTAFNRITPERVEWLERDRVPLGGLTLVVGDPGLGKSQLTVELAARTSRGELVENGIALMVTAEDSTAAVVRPRLEAAGADLARVHTMTVGHKGDERGIVLPEDVDGIAAAVEKTGAKLVVIDPLTAHLTSSVNSWRDQDVRRALAPLHRLAEASGCAIVLVAHLNKSKGSDPLYRTGGSIGITAAIRSGLVLMCDPDDPDGETGSRRVLAQFKSNYGKLAKSLKYEVKSAVIEGGIKTSRLERLGESSHSARELLAEPDEDQRTDTEAAAEWLQDELADGQWHTSREVTAGAKRAGHAGRTTQRAAKQLGVEAERKGFPAISRWRLPSRAMPSGATGAGASGTTDENRMSKGDSTPAPSQSRHISDIGATGANGRSDEAEIERLIGEAEDAEREADVLGLKAHDDS